MAISIRARKSKGRRLQNYIRDVFRSIFKETLEEGDVESRQMGGAGTDVVLSPLAKKLIPFDIECKNVEKFNINSTIKQAKDNSKEGRIPLIVFTKNQDEVYVGLTLLDFLRVAYPEWYNKTEFKGKFTLLEIDSSEGA